jgi:hypothetical protein
MGHGTITRRMKDRWMFRGTMIKQYVRTACSSVILHHAKRLAYRLQVAGCRLQVAGCRMHSTSFVSTTYSTASTPRTIRVTVVLPECRTTASRAAGFAARLGRLPSLETRWGERRKAKSPIETVNFLHTPGIHIPGMKGRLTGDMDVMDQVSIDHASKIQYFRTSQPELTHFK